MTTEGPDPAAELLALTEQLRSSTRELRKEVTPEWLATLTEAQRKVIYADLLALQRISRKVAARIAAHISDMESQRKVIYADLLALQRISRKVAARIAAHTSDMESRA